MKEKILLREELRSLIESFSEEYRTKADEAIAEAVIESDEYKAASNVFSYIGVGSEVATVSIISHAIDSGKSVFAPVTHAGGIMDAVELISKSEDHEHGGEHQYEGILNDLSVFTNTHGLVEPDAGRIADAEEIDLVLVPCLSCDPFGNRVGYGGGYYDRYLKRFCEHKPPFFALTRERSLSTHLPHGHNDVIVDGYFTEAGKFSSIILL